MTRLKDARNAAAREFVDRISAHLDHWVAVNHLETVPGHRNTVGEVISFIFSACAAVTRKTSFEAKVAKVMIDLERKDLIGGLREAIVDHARAVMSGAEFRQTYHHDGATITFDSDGHTISVGTIKANVHFSPSRREEGRLDDREGDEIRRIYEDAIRRETGDRTIAVRLGHRGQKAADPIVPVDGRGALPSTDYVWNLTAGYVMHVIGTGLLLINDGRDDDPVWARYEYAALIERAPLERLQLEAADTGRRIAHMQAALPWAQTTADDVMKAIDAEIAATGGPCRLMNARAWVTMKDDGDVAISLVAHVLGYNSRTFFEQCVPIRMNIREDGDVTRMVHETIGHWASTTAAQYRRLKHEPLKNAGNAIDLSPYSIEKPLLSKLTSLGIDPLTEVEELVRSGWSRRTIGDVTMHIRTGRIGGSFEIATGIHWRRGYLRLEDFDIPESIAVSIVGQSVGRVMMHPQIPADMMVTRTMTTRHKKGTITNVHLRNVMTTLDGNPTAEIVAKDEAKGKDL